MWVGFPRNDRVSDGTLTSNRRCVSESMTWRLASLDAALEVGRNTVNGVDPASIDRLNADCPANSLFAIRDNDSHHEPSEGRFTLSTSAFPRPDSADSWWVRI